MKILYHHRTASKDGQDVHISNLVAALRRRGHEVVVVGPSIAGAVEFGGEVGWVAGMRRRLPKAVTELLEMAYSVPAYFRLRKVFRHFQPDVLYERYNLFFLAGYWLKVRTGVPVLLEVNAPLRQERRAHGGLALSALAAWSERLVWRSAERILPVTRVLAGLVVAAGVDEARIQVIANGVDRRHFPDGVDGSVVRRSLGLDGKLVLGFTGFLRAWHGLAGILDLMNDCRERDDLHLLVIGDGPARGELEAKARSLGLEDRLSVLGVVAHDQMRDYVAAFDIALQPMAVDYASPLKLFEYMALGRAIVAPDQPNLREVLRHEDNALLFRPGDAADLRAAVARLCRDEDLRRRLGRNASLSIDAEDLTWDGNARRVEASAKELLPDAIS